MKKAPTLEVGTYLRIPLKDGSFAYGRVLSNPYVAFYDLETKEPSSEPVVRFTQELADFRKCTIFDSAGRERPATPEECVGLERAEVWEIQHIEDRLLDTFEGRHHRGPASRHRGQIPPATTRISS